jgi:hypothetical protein
VCPSSLQRGHDAFVKPELGTGEITIKRWRANHVRGRRAVGGTLWLTNWRLVFMPHGVERISGQTEWTRYLADVTSVEVADRQAVAFSGGLRKRLLVRSPSGDEYFVVNRVSEVAASLVDAVAAA